VPFWKQNPNPNLRNGTAPTRDYYPLSIPVYAPQMNPPSMENPGSTLPSDGFSARPNYVLVDVSFGEHDALGGALMRVAQADLYDSAVGAFPRAGTWEEPGAAVAVMQLVRLSPTTSAHPGLNLSTGPGPNMLFVAPPVFSVQTQPIYATGL
jgi:hypothetical protein